MRIRDVTLNCSIYLYESEQDARAGRPTGGSGFVVGVPYSRNQSRPHLYFVTNLHVASKCRFVRLNRVGGGTSVVPAGSWVPHPNSDDWAVAPFDSDDSHTIACITPKAFVTEQVAKEYLVGPGDEVFMVGRFVNHDGHQQNLPIVRGGAIAAGPSEPVVDGRGLLARIIHTDDRRRPSGRV